MTLKELEGNPGIPGDPGPPGPPYAGIDFGFKSGLWYAPTGLFETNYTYASIGSFHAKLMVIPFLVARTTEFELFGVEVTSGSDTTRITPGIYRDNGGGAPGALFIEGVQMSTASNGLAFNGAGGGPGISAELERGLYWLASILDLNNKNNLALRSWYPRVQSWFTHQAVNMDGVQGIIAEGNHPTMPDPFPGPGSFIAGQYMPKVMLKAL